MKDSSLKRKVVIFGCGYVGSKLAESCLEKGWEVTALTRNHATADSLKKRGIETIVADLMDRIGMTKYHSAELSG